MRPKRQFFDLMPNLCPSRGRFPLNHLIKRASAKGRNLSLTTWLPGSRCKIETLDDSCHIYWSDGGVKTLCDGWRKPSLKEASQVMPQTMHVISLPQATKITPPGRKFSPPSLHPPASFSSQRPPLPLLIPQLAMAAPAVQGIALPNSKEPGYSSVYRNAKYTDALQPYETAEVRTLFESFERSVKQNPKHDCLGHREYDRKTKTWGPYIWESYEEIHARRTRFGSGLLNLFEQVAKVSSPSLFV